MAETMLAGGLPVAEITFRTDAAEQVDYFIASEHPDLLAGGGTVIIDMAKGQFKLAKICRRSWAITIFNEVVLSKHYSDVTKGGIFRPKQCAGLRYSNTEVLS